jgi:hypothetical protein
MKEIKSVRVRRKFASTDDNLSGISDYKVTLYDNGRNKFKVGAGQIGRVFLNSEYRREGRYENFSNDDFIKDGINVLISKQNGDKEFEIIQDPWLDTPPKWRSFGFDFYYLSNGSQVYIKWLEGTISAGGKKWSDDDGNELSFSKNGDSKSSIEKNVEIFAPYSYEGQKIMKLTNEGIKAITDQTKESIFTGNVTDKDILNLVISKWNSQVPNYNVSLCNPDYIKCEINPYISPVDELQDIEEKLETPEETKSVKEKLNVVLPKDLNLKIKQDISFKIFVGDPPKTEKPVVDGFDFGDEDDLSDLLLEDEFRETEFGGLSEAESKLQEEISKGQEIFDKGTAPPLPDKIDISISRNLDDLLKDAGRAARILGKNSRVKYENLRQGYINGIHGLCPQGTQAVLVALTGIKELGLLSGNADWFSFKNPATGGSAHSTGNGFDISIKGKSYYNTKTRINQINGSWKGTYLQDSKLWQVGDIVAMGYTGGKLYGHIQIWTGYSWMSDFKQNAIQQKNVDPNTVALWRFNQNGINLIKNKSSIV